MTKKRTEYSESFKAEAIAKVKENDDNVSLTAKELGIPMQTLAEWQKFIPYLTTEVTTPPTSILSSHH